MYRYHLGVRGPASSINGEGCQNHVGSCCGSVVLVQEAAESVAAPDIAAGRCVELWRRGRRERESAVRALAVVVLDVDA